MPAWRSALHVRTPKPGAWGLVALITGAYGVLFVEFYGGQPGSWEMTGSATTLVIMVWFAAITAAGWALGRVWGSIYAIGLTALQVWLFDLQGKPGMDFVTSGIAAVTLAFTVMFVYLSGTNSDLYREARERTAELRGKNDALAQGEAMFRQFAERIELGVWIMDARDHVTYLNPAARRLMRVPEAAAYVDNTHPQDRALVRDAYAALKRGESTDVEYRILVAEGARWIRAQSFPIKDASGAVTQLVGVMEDVTERKEREMQRDVLARRERLTALGTLVAGVAHEVNNPLTYVMGNLELAHGEIAELHVEDADAPKRERVQRLVATSLSGGERIAKLVKALRAVSRQEHSGERDPVKLNALVANVHELMRAATPKSVAIELRLAPDDPVVLGRASELHQIVLNLATNAVQAMPKGGTLVLETQARPEGSAILVRDTGHGIKPEDHARLFTPFFTTKPEGTGLGLSLALKLAREHGGDIEVESRAGEGALFRVLLPSRALEAAA